VSGEGPPVRACLGPAGFFLFIFSFAESSFSHSANLSFCRVFFMTLGKPLFAECFLFDAQQTTLFAECF